MQTLKGAADAGQWAQIAIETDGSTPRARLRSRANGGASASAWQDILTSGQIVGTMSGGAVIETGSSANGTYTKYADGTLVCSLKRLALPYRSASDCHASWTFPAAFVSTSALTVQACLTPATDAADPNSIAANAACQTSDLGAPAVGTLSATAAAIAVHRITGTTDFATGNSVHVTLTATGRWK